MLATKIKSAINRQNDDKYIKDICDIYAISWYSDIKYNKIRTDIHKMLDESYFKKLLERIKKDKSIFKKANNAIDIDSKTIMNNIEKLCS